MIRFAVFCAAFVAAAGCRTTSSGTSGAQSSTPAAVSYACTYVHQGKKPQAEAQSVALDQGFAGYDRGETIKVASKDGKFVIESVTMLDQKPYLSYSTTCDVAHNCSGYRDKAASRRGNPRETMKPTPGGSTVFTYLKKRPVFRFRTLERGFEFWSIKELKGTTLAKGTVVACSQN